MVYNVRVYAMFGLPVEGWYNFLWPGMCKPNLGVPTEGQGAAQRAVGRSNAQ
jgi:hypothetical protein